MNLSSTSKCNDSDDVSVGLDKSFSKNLNSGASRVFCTASLHPKQQEAIRRIIRNKLSKGRLLGVDRTGGGKTLILHMMAILVGGIALVIIPLLFLTANQFERIKHAVQRYCAVYAYHLDKCSKHDTKEKLIPKMDEFEYYLSTTMFILCSPQYLTENIDFCNALLQCRDCKVLRLIAVNKAHIYAMQGSTFREPIRIVGRDFFSKLYGKSHQILPLFLAMTATMPLKPTKTFSKLTSINSEDPCHLMCSTPQEFQQHYIDMDFHVQADVGSCLTCYSLFWWQKRLMQRERL
mmetsp:Transcript_13122/g.28347  ORF Transcript_13122/g.28347 Transcript_13122/m.28347 type:complete len:292 (-) Transcript_13122:1026-1901(-)